MTIPTKALICFAGKWDMMERYWDVEGAVPYRIELSSLKNRNGKSVPVWENSVEIATSSSLAELVQAHLTASLRTAWRFLLSPQLRELWGTPYSDPSQWQIWLRLPRVYWPSQWQIMWKICWYVKNPAGLFLSLSFSFHYHSLFLYSFSFSFS